jgi:hypothetical protein
MMAPLIPVAGKRLGRGVVLARDGLEPPPPAFSRPSTDAVTYQVQLQKHRAMAGTLFETIFIQPSRLRAHGLIARFHCQRVASALDRYR